LRRELLCGILNKMSPEAQIHNRKARYNFEILESVEAGLTLKGPEVKSLRIGKASLQEAYAREEKGEIFIYKMHIEPYKFANIANENPLRKRKLLLHGSQIRKLTRQLHEKGLALIPLKLYFKGGFAKIELGICRGKKKFDKRQDIKKRESAREVKRAIKGKR